MKKRPASHQKPTLEPTPDCPIQKTCGLCLYVNTPYEKGLAAKYQKDLAQLQRIFPVPVPALPPVASPKKLRYRTSMKLAIRSNVRGWIEIGVFKPNSHQVVEMQQCPLHAPILQKLIYKLPLAVKEADLVPWREDLQEGEIKFVAARCAHLTEQLMVTFVVTDMQAKEKVLRCAEILSEQGLSIDSLNLNINPSKGNEIFGPETHRLSGLKRLRETLCSLSLSLSPTSFLQVNPWIASKMYHRIEQLAGAPNPGAVAIDLYSGVGQIAMVLARNGYRVAAIEETPSAKEDASTNLQLNRLQQSVEFFSCPVEEFSRTHPDWANNPQLIVVNPSRKGLSDSARTYVTTTTKKSGSTLIYVSCNLTTLLRDLEFFQQDSFRVHQVEAFDLFAQTDKLEWLVVLSPSA